MKLNEKQKVFAVAMFFLVLVGGVATMNFIKFKDRRQLMTQMARYHREEKAAQQKIKRIPKLLEERAELIATIGRYAQILPVEANVQHEAFVEFIDSFRKDTKITIQTAVYVRVKGNRRGTKAQESFIRHRYKFSLLGTVPDFIQFLNKIENHTRFLKVDAFKIKPYLAKDADGGGGAVKNKELLYASNRVKELELTISTYTYKGAKGTTQS
ncbi:MAG: hypothetical protein O7J95_10920 [Planctomycetota bacterium]|nr:hypothetical protein [Planctomycetota bacterium]